MLLPRNILANIHQSEAWLLPSLKGAIAVIITALPLYHIFSLTVNCLLMLQDVRSNILISNPRDIPAQVMKGYWQRPDETAKVLGPDGFLYTGDIGVMDEKGFVTIVDRKKDMILVSGFNVYPNEIEQVVAMHPGVLECAAIGVADEHSGEVPKVFVVKKDPNLTEQDVLEHCKKELTGYKRPKYVEFRTELPKTNVGKILRRALREEKKAA